MPGRRSDADARDTRAAILRRAAAIGSVDGLEQVTIGRLAADLAMSKAGVIGHFGSKEELQLATVAMASDVFRTAVWEPVASVATGLPRLLAICTSWTSYADDPPFPGGCFLNTASMEFAGQDGPVHDALSTRSACGTSRWCTTPSPPNGRVTSPRTVTRSRSSSCSKRSPPRSSRRNCSRATRRRRPWPCTRCGRSSNSLRRPSTPVGPVGPLRRRRPRPRPRRRPAS